MESLQNPETLTARGLKKSFGGRTVVNGIDVDLQAGEVAGLLGPNGAGKTTTFYMVVGLCRPESGEISMCGKSITKFPVYMRARQGLSYLPQEPSIFRHLSVEDNLLAILETVEASKELRKQRTEELLTEFRIAHIAKSMGYSLSGGERRRVEIARALATKPKFILLDEPFAGIDPLAVIDIQNIIGQLKAKNIGILISDHNVRETLGVCDKAYIVNSGEILECGTPEQIINSRKAREIYLGDKFRL
jgi:lipopolysaccharide export system ATP-binding protein